MSKRLRAILASLLVVTLLVTSLSFAALSEAAPAEPAETQAEATEVSVEEPAAEATETPAEEPAAEATEAPTEEPATEATEAPVEEPTAEPTEVPVEEPAEDGNESSETSGELSDAQKETLENLPTGFSAETVALAMMRSTGCAHTCLYVEENCDSEQCTALNDEKHAYTYRVKSRKLKCDDCGKTLQEITVNETISKEERHAWVNIGATTEIECYECGMTKTVSKPCSHKDSFGMGEDGNLHCWECGAIEVLNPEQTYCKHKNYTEYGTKASPLVEYVAFSKEQHVKHSDIMTFSDGWGFAICDDCGEWLELKNGKVISVGITDYSCDDSRRESVLEPHTFVNGVCKYCGYQKQEAKPCDHSAGNFRDELDESVSPKYFNITETTHCVQHSYKRYCKDCGAYIKNVVDEGITPEAHDFSKSNTCLCGYQKQEEDEQTPYVCGFTMSQTTAKVGDTVKFTLELANVKDGEALELQFIADGQLIETFSLTAPQNIFEHEFSKAGNRKLQFRVTGGECCPGQTLKVETNAPKVETVSLSLGTDKNFTITEKAEGEKITAKIACNENTGIAELYVGESYAFSEEYIEENGRRIFTLEITLGGNNASYAGKYEMRANALKQRYVVDDMDKKSIGTLTVKHDYVTISSKQDKYWKKTADGHTLYEKTTVEKKCTICTKTTTETTDKAIGSLTAHTFNDADVCTECKWEKSSIKTDLNVETVEVNGNHYVTHVGVGTSGGYQKPYYYLEPKEGFDANAKVIDTIINQFDVMGTYNKNTVFYYPDSNGTYCTTFARDVASAVGAYYPAYTCKECHLAKKGNMSEDLEKFLQARNLICTCGGGTARLQTYSGENNVNTDATAWMKRYATKYGWEEITGASRTEKMQNVIDSANAGYLTIGMQYGHTFIVHPNDKNKINGEKKDGLLNIDLYITQAGKYDVGAGKITMSSNKSCKNGMWLQNPSKDIFTYYKFTGNYQ